MTGRLIRAGNSWQLSLPGMLVGALVFGLLKSTQYLVQPFVWRNWPLDEVLLGWLDVARDNVVIALPVAAALYAGLRLAPRGRPVLASLILGPTLILGATSGQFALVVIDSPAAADDPTTLIGRAFAWSLAAACVAGIYILRQRASDAGQALLEARLLDVQAGQQAVRARVQALRRQIEPHFLFNTLATVRQLHHAEPDEGARLLAHLTNYLRLALPGLQEQRSSLGQELELVRAYLGVVGVRLSDRLQVVWDVPSKLAEQEFPPLVLATLVENAIQHGIAPATHGGTLQIVARSHGAMLELIVSDTGVGFCGSSSGGSGIGLVNIRARLLALYGPAGQLTLEVSEPHGVRACVRIPLRALESGE